VPAQGSSLPPFRLNDPLEHVRTGSVSLRFGQRSGILDFGSCSGNQQRAGTRAERATPDGGDRMPLTKRQKEILDHIDGFIGERGYAPSFEEIAHHFDYSSLATVHEHLSNLERKGYIRKSYNESRSIEVVKPETGPQAIELPLFGLVAAGFPIEAISQSETLAVPPDMVRRGHDNYVLKVQGDSMIDEQIRDGDYIVVSAQDTAENGQMVVALVGDDAATVKKLYREPGDRVRLQPANVAMTPLVVEAAQVQVQGVVVGVIRKY